MKKQRKLKTIEKFSSQFLQSFSAFQHISAHYYVRFFALNILKNKRITAHFLHNFWKISRPGDKTKYDNFFPEISSLLLIYKEHQRVRYS